jgi:hypothetical protein
MKETAEAIDPDDSSKEMGRRHIELGILKREPYGPDPCVVSPKPPDACGALIRPTIAPPKPTVACAPPSQLVLTRVSLRDLQIDRSSRATDFLRILTSRAGSFMFFRGRRSRARGLVLSR